MTDSLALKMAIDICNSRYCLVLALGDWSAGSLGPRLQKCNGYVQFMCQIRFVAIIRFANSQDFFEPYSSKALRKPITDVGSR